MIVYYAFDYTVVRKQFSDVIYLDVFPLTDQTQAAARTRLFESISFWPIAAAPSHSLGRQNTFPPTAHAKLAYNMWYVCVCAEKTNKSGKTSPVLHYSFFPSPPPPPSIVGGGNSSSYPSLAESFVWSLRTRFRFSNEPHPPPATITALSCSSPPVLNNIPNFHR